jgi:hypothetical protein
MELRKLFKVWGDLGLGIGKKGKLGFVKFFFLRKGLGKWVEIRDWYLLAER